MRFVCMAVCIALAFFLYPSGVFDIPFAQLTLGNIFRLVGAIIFGLGAIGSLFGD